MWEYTDAGVEQVCDRAQVTWTSRIRKFTRGLALLLGYIVLFLVVFGSIGMSIETVDGFVRDCQRCPGERERYSKPVGGYRTGYYAGSDV